MAYETVDKEFLIHLSIADSYTNCEQIAFQQMFIFQMDISTLSKTWKVT